MDQFIANVYEGNEDDLKKIEMFLPKMSTTGDITTWKDHIFGPIFPSTTIQYCYESWQPKDGDIVIASYPKTGTHWVYGIVRYLLYGDDKYQKHLSDEMTMPFLYLECGPVSVFKIVDKLPFRRRVFITHLPATLINLEKWKSRNVKIIYIMRNPKDQAVSWYHFSQGFPYLKLPSFDKRVPSDWNKWFESYTAGALPDNLKEGQFYPDNILTWIPHRNEADIMFVTYEKIKQNPSSAVKKIARFIGCDSSDHTITRVVKNSTLHSLRRSLEASSTAESALLTKMKMYRKGQVGDWKNFFTVAQSEKMDKIMSEKLAGTDVTFIFE
ncbi:unnamed protein product [Clavelina lepadiformis]|uniref:Sulfotransferase n=1 Tax=Clavelina lepadiformis TaxID=159417 RepID=A0ABP0G0G9_CLALP